MGAANKIGLLEVYLVADRSKEVNLAESFITLGKFTD
jgi:hypothetical protein